MHLLLLRGWEHFQAPLASSGSQGMIVRMFIELKFYGKGLKEERAA